MTRIEFAQGVTDDFDRIVEHLRQHESENIAVRVEQIIHAIDALEHNPRIGRPVDRLKRELIIGHDTRGYIALYTYAAKIDTVLVLALRSQREAGYAPLSDAAKAAADPSTDKKRHSRRQS